MAQWTDNDTLEVWQGGEQIPLHALYSIMLEIPESKILTHAPYAGGQFGGWDVSLYSQCCHIPLAALLSKKTKMPVKLYNRRQDEHFGEMDEGVFNCKVGFKNDGTITAVDIDSKVAQCSDMGFSPDTMGGGHFIESTGIPNIQGIGTCVFLNKHGFGASRCEQQIDAHVKQQVFTRVAAALGVDEGTIALKNDGQEGHDMAWVSEFKQMNKIPDVDSLSLVLETGKGAIDWNEKFHAPGQKMLPNGKLHGMCLSPNHEFSNGGAISPYTVWYYPCHMSIESGKVFLTADRPDCGLDGRTGYSRIIAEEMGMKLEDVNILVTKRQIRQNPILSGLEWGFFDFPLR
jgi:xanthine dehydrogenase molybdenum-binding subunit